MSFTVAEIQQLLAFLQVRPCSDLATQLNLMLLHETNPFLLKLITYMKDNTLDLCTPMDFLNALKLCRKTICKLPKTKPGDLKQQYLWICKNVFANGIFLEFTNDQNLILAAVIRSIGNQNVVALTSLWDGLQTMVNGITDAQNAEYEELAAYPDGLPENFQDGWDYLGTRSWGIKAKKNIRIICREALNHNRQIIENDWNVMFYRDNKCYVSMCDKYGLDASEIVL